MLSNYYRYLNLPEDSFDKNKLSSDVSIDLDKNRNKHWNRLDNYFTNDIKEWLLKFNYTLTNAELFYTAPFGQLPWHIDMNPPENFVKINFVWGSKNHLMEWGELKNANISIDTFRTEVGSQYSKFTQDQIDSKIAITITKPILVNVGKPHRVVNLSREGRWCFCMILTCNDRRIFFNDAVNTLNEYVLD
jgi:hypothetical protein